jgi:DNA helicase II / ATP-dependent DNA helicase PcrA
MLSNNLAKIASAGSGKSTSIIEDALKNRSQRILITTFTIEGTEELKRIMLEKHGAIPNNVSIMSWMSFLIQECIRPYQLAAFNCAITKPVFVQGRSTRGISKTAKHYYLCGNNDIYSDKLSEFAIYCDELTKGCVISRLSKVFDRIYCDEFQDLAGYDFNLIEALLKTQTQIVIVTDPRQATYSTNESAKNGKFKKAGVSALLEKWEKDGLCKIEINNWSHRCNQKICDFADVLYPEFEKTISKNALSTGHDGVFRVKSNSVQEYISRYTPVVLRYNKTTAWGNESIRNFGAVKGRTFERVLLIPNGPLENFLKGKPITSPSKYYVALTRAKHSVAICFDGALCTKGIEEWAE